VMRELAQWVFEAGQGETVSIRVVPRESEARYVGVWLDDRVLQAEPNPYSYPYLIYSFNIRRPASQSHVIKLECNFSLLAPPTASYDLWISGSLGSGEFLRTVKRDDLRDVDILFTIAKPAAPRVVMDEKVSQPEQVDEAHDAARSVAAGGAQDVLPTIKLSRIVLTISIRLARELLAALTEALKKDEIARQSGAGLPDDGRVAIVVSNTFALELLME